MRKGFLAVLLTTPPRANAKSARIGLDHPLLGKPLIRLVLESVFKLKPEKVCVVLDSPDQKIREEISSTDVCFVKPKKEGGEVQALIAVKSLLRKEREKDVLVLNARLPLLRPQTLKSLLSLHQRKRNSVTLMSACVCVFRINDLLLALSKIGGKNSRRELNLADVVEQLSQNKKKIGVWQTSQPEEVIAVNFTRELVRAASVLRERKILSLSRKGVTVRDPLTTWIDLDVQIGEGTVVFPSVIVEGTARIGSHCQICPFVHIIDSEIGNHVRILSSTVVEGSIIEDGAQVGPFAHLRPKTVIRAGARVGNFVEIKNTVLGERSKAGHLSYLGDSEVGEDVNIGAGTITCNFDGVKKNKTTIEAGAFIGSGTELVAPVKVGRGAYIGAGSTITKNVSPEALAIARGKQFEKPGWARRKRK